MIPSHSRREAFTLIELLTVMAIIVILAGLILSTAGYASGKAARARAQGEIKALESAINSYQVDNGAIPRNQDTNALNARGDAGVAGTTYQKTSLYLFRTLGGYYDVTGTTVGVSKVYFPFKSNQIYPSTAVNSNGSITSPTSVTYLIDPFGLSYAYSTGPTAEAEANAASGSTQPQKIGYNPTYDLWSTAGYGTGKPYPNGTTDKSVFWISNWNNQ